jgi:hypothetical protein
VISPITTTTQNDELEIVGDAAHIAHAVWRKTDFDKIDAHRSLDDEFASRIATAALTDSVASFLDRLRKKWGVRAITDSGSDAEEVKELVEEYDQDQTSARKFLRTVRNNSALVVLEMKNEYSNGDSE